MPERRPDVVEVVVLAADAHALLRRRRARVGALLAPEEDVLELVHPRVGEEQRRVVARHERRARDDAVSVPLEVVEETGGCRGVSCVAQVMVRLRQLRYVRLLSCPWPLFYFVVVAPQLAERLDDDGGREALAHQVLIEAGLFGGIGGA